MKLANVLLIAAVLMSFQANATKDPNCANQDKNSRYNNKRDDKRRVENVLRDKNQKQSDKDAKATS